MSNPLFSPCLFNTTAGAVALKRTITIKCATEKHQKCHAKASKVPQKGFKSATYSLICVTDLLFCVADLLFCATDLLFCVADLSLRVALPYFML